MDIGTGKDIDEYGEVKVHLLDVAEAGEKYNLHRYLSDFHKVMEGLQAEGKPVVVCGGTGMYLEAALRGVKLPEVPENKQLRQSLEGKSIEELTVILASMKSLHNTTDTDTVKRAIRAIEIETYYLEHPQEALDAKPSDTPQSAPLIGVDIPRDVRRAKILNRLHQRLDEGMVEEVQDLMKNGVSAEQLIYYGLEYKFLTLYITGKMSREEMIEGLYIAICQFAKRQMTWFRGMERRGLKINWLPYDLPDSEFNGRVLEIVKDWRP